MSIETGKYAALGLLFIAVVVVAEPHEDDLASDEGGAPVVIGPDDDRAAYRDPQGSVHYKSDVLGTEVCTRIDEPDPSIAFDQGATYVTPCADDAR